MLSWELKCWCFFWRCHLNGLVRFPSLAETQLELFFPWDTASSLASPVPVVDTGTSAKLVWRCPLWSCLISGIEECTPAKFELLVRPAGPLTLMELQHFRFTTIKFVSLVLSRFFWVPDRTFQPKNQHCDILAISRIQKGFLPFLIYNLKSHKALIVLWA